MATFPCLVRHTYIGCVGLAACAGQGQTRCWTGHALAIEGGQRMLHEITVERRTGSQCSGCANVVEAPMQKRTGHGRQDLRLLTCSAGLWAGTCSVWGLVNGRVPLRAEGWPPCPRYVAAETLLPEVAAQRVQDAERARERRRRLREQGHQQAVVAS